MTKAQLIEAIMAGATVALVEYRQTKVEVVNYRNKENGRPEQMRKFRHHVEGGGAAFASEERVPEGLSLDTYKPPFTKGQSCVWHIQSMSKVKGVERNSGELEPYTEK